MTISFWTSNYMKTYYYFGSHQQALLFGVFGERSEEGEQKALAEYIQALSPESVLALKKAVDEVLNTIPYKQREVLKLLYGIDTNLPPFTRKQIADMFNFTTVCARQHELLARRMCRHPSRIKHLLQFVPNQD